MIKRSLRRALVGVCVILTMPSWLPVLMTRRFSTTKADDAFRAGCDVMSLFPGILGVFLRRGYYLMTLEAFSTDCQIAFGTVFTQPTARIGREVVIGRFCTVGSADIRDGTAIGSNVDILSGRRQHASPGRDDQDVDTPVQYRVGRLERMRIGPNAWLGNSCVIMSHVGAGGVVGAGAVVVKEVPTNATVVGNPATVKKQTPKRGRKPFLPIENRTRETACVVRVHSTNLVPQTSMLTLLNRRFIRPMLALKSGSRVYQYLRLLEQTQYDPPEVIRARQLCDLKRIVHHAYDTTPYYQRRFREIGLHPSDIRSFADYEALPILSKADIRIHQSELLSSAFQKENLTLKQTSGSTGVPLRVYLDRRGLEWKLACTLRSDQWSGWRIGQPVAKVWGNPEFRQFGWRGWIWNKYVERAIHLDTLNVTTEVLNAYTADFNRHRPGLLFGHAHSLYLFACHVKKHKLGVHSPNGIISTAMPLHRWQRTVIEEIFQCRVTNRYGCEETSLIASECEMHDGLHLNSDSLYCETQAEEGPGPLLITDLTNYAMPLLRYQVGDIVVPMSDDTPCACGRGLPRIAQIEGREADYVLTPTGRLVSGISLTENFALHIPGTEQVQIIQDRIDHLRLRVVAGEDFGPRSLELIKELVARTFDGSMTHELELVDGIPREPSGKYRFCISEVAREHMRAMSA